MRGKLKWARFAANGFKHQQLARLSAATGLVAHKPFFIELGLTSRCNLRCVQCSQWKENTPEAVTTERWTALVRELYDWMGPFQLTMAWAEALLHPGVYDVISAASSLGVSTCLISNGTLIDAAAARRLAQSRLGRLVVSIDGNEAATHDATRGVPGAFDLSMRGLGLVLAQPGRPAVNVAAIFHGRNLRELPALTARVREMGAEGINFQPLGQSGEGWRELWPSDPAAVDAAVDELIAMRRAGAPILNSEWVLRGYKAYFRGQPAGAAGGYCKSYLKAIIRHNGDVQLCRYRPPVGNILRDGPVREIFLSPAGRAALHKIRSCAEPCLLMNCHHFNTWADRARELRPLLGLKP
jgi:MoaA/NifB/PqqE/SkfB family radical SAM enzyme